MATHEGLKGRVYGFVLGAVCLGVGALLLAMIVAKSNLFSPGMRESVAGIAPMFERSAGTPPMEGANLAILGVATAVFLLVALYQFVSVFFASDYSFTFKRTR